MSKTDSAWREHTEDRMGEDGGAPESTERRRTIYLERAPEQKGWTIDRKVPIASIVVVLGIIGTLIAAWNNLQTTSLEHGRRLSAVEVTLVEATRALQAQADFARRLQGVEASGAEQTRQLQSLLIETKDKLAEVRNGQTAATGTLEVLRAQLQSTTATVDAIRQQQARNAAGNRVGN